MKTTILGIMVASLLLGACSDQSNSPGDGGAKDTQALADLKGGDLKGPDIKGQDLVAADQQHPDAIKPDSAGDAILADAPVGDAPTAGTFTAQITKVQIWANLMPPTAPDPTIVILSLSLTNKGKTDITGIKLTDSSVIPPAPKLPQAFQATAQGGFTGTVKAGQTVKVEFRKVQSSSAVPMPAACKDTVKVKTSVAYSGGKIGPLVSAAVAFSCVH